MKLTFPFADGIAKLSKRDHEFREPTSRREQTERSEVSVKNFKANRESLNRQNQQMTLKPVPTSGRSKVTSSIVITMNVEFNFMCRRKKHSIFCRHDTHSQYTSISTTVCAQARNAQTSRLAQELHCHLCAPEKSLVIWCVACLILGCLTCLSPRASLLLLLRPFLPHTENTQYITHISKLRQSTSCAIKNHSGVKTCRVAETRALQLSQIPLKYIDVTRSSRTDRDVMQEKRVDEYWNVDSNRSLSDSWKGF